MDLCVVVPAHNEEQVLDQQLQALLAQDWEGDWEIVVVDNRSTDGTSDLVERYAARTDNLRLLRADRKADKAYAVNEAAASTTAPALAFCDADDA